MRLALLALVPFLVPQEKPNWTQIVERGQKNLERERELRAAIPREAFDVDALAKSLGGDPAKAAEFVRTRIAIEPTRGFVKGAQGALVSQRAGWADRALLLAALVADKSPKLVKGTLAAAKQPAFAVTPPPPTAATPADVAARLKTDPARLEKKAKEGDAATAAFREKLQARVQRDLAAVAAALVSAGVKPPAAVAAPDEVWWVRIGDKDLEKPEGAEEQAVVAVSELPAADVHRLTVRMTIQQGDAEAVVLDVSYRTMDLFGRVLTFSTVSGENTQKLTKLQSPKPKDHLDVLAATTIFVPLLSGVGKPVSGHPFDLTGAKVAVEKGAIISKKVGGALDAFESLPGGGEKKELTGARLEVVRSAPGAEPVSSRREILKKGVKGRQRVFDLLQMRDLLVLPGDLRGDFALDLVLQSDIAVKEALLPKMQLNALFVEKRPLRLNTRLYEFALARAAALRGLKVSTGTAVVTFVRRIVDGKPATIRAGFDILSNPASGPSAAGWADHPAFVAGIIDTALEHEVHRAKGPRSNASVQIEEAKQPLKAALGEGRIRVVVPGKIRAWYEIDSATGGCLGYTEEGGGQDMAEYATLLADRLEEIREFQSHAELVNSILECAMNALGAADAEGSFGRCVAGVAIGEAFGWAAGGIIGNAAGDNPFARLGGMGLEDALGDALDDAIGASPLGR